MFSYTDFGKGLFISPLNYIKNKLDSWEIKEKNIAKKIVSLIPSQCPFAQDICVFDRKIVTIPPLCKLNPFYENLMILRFRALCFLSEIGEDVTPYC